jgi:hypothetical protein
MKTEMVQQFFANSPTSNFKKIQAAPLKWYHAHQQMEAMRKFNMHFTGLSTFIKRHTDTLQTNDPCMNNQSKSILKY